MNIECAEDFINALITNQRIWPNCYGQSVAMAAFVVYEERLKAQQEINRLQEELTKSRQEISRLQGERYSAIRAMKMFAENNPKFEYYGEIQDPCGVHKWLERNDY